MKPENSKEFALPHDLTQAALCDALTMLELPPEDVFPLSIRVGTASVADAAEIAKLLNGNTENVRVSVKLDASFGPAEWSVTTVHGGCVWSPGA